MALLVLQLTFLDEAGNLMPKFKSLNLPVFPELIDSTKVVYSMGQVLPLLHQVPLQLLEEASIWQIFFKLVLQLLHLD